MDLFGALVFQVIGQQISVIAATAIFARLTGSGPISYARTTLPCATRSRRATAWITSLTRPR